MNRGVLLVPLLGVTWGLNWPAVRICLTEIPPWTLRAWGFGLATILMFGLFRLLGKPLAVPRGQWGRLAIVALFSTVAYNMLTAFAQLSATTSRSAVLSYTMPIWTVVLARLFLGERLDRRRTIGLSLGAAGLAALGSPLLLAGQLSWGLLWATLSGVAWAVGTVYLKRRPIDAEPWVIGAWQMALGTLAATVGMLLFEGPSGLLPLSGPVLLAFGYHVVFAQALATSLWFAILERLPAGIAAIGALLVPGVGVVSATLLLGERPTAADWLGLVLIVGASATVLLRVRSGPARA